MPQPLSRSHGRHKKQRERDRFFLVAKWCYTRHVYKHSYAVTPQFSFFSSSYTTPTSFPVSVNTLNTIRLLSWERKIL